MITQTVALFVDAYRHLNAKKLFWITLGLTALFAAAFASIGVTENGIVLLAWEISIPMFSLSALPSKAFFYKSLFFELGFKLWLTWAATILALVSTCGIMPDFVSGGTIELTLSKPIGRARLFLTKYLAGLLFVILQVAVFTVASLFVIGVRGEEWVWSILLAIPLVTLFYSYLYCVMAVLGIVTRSAIASLLLTLLLWFVIFLANFTETGVFLQFREMNRQAVSIIEGKTSMAQDELAEAREAGEDEAVEEAEGRLEDLSERVEEARDDLRMWTNLHAWAFGVKTLLPKTGETMDLLERWIITDEEFRSAIEGQSQNNPGMQGQTIHGEYVSPFVVAEEVEKELRSRSVAWIIGTSLVFELAVLGFGVWVFSRRDY